MSFFRFAKQDEENATLYIDDIIGLWPTAKDFREELQAQGNIKNLTLEINSPGGDVIDGFAIYNQLVEHPAKVHTKINGWAASMASIIAMAGDTVEMASNSWLMIHNPWGMTMGESDDFRSMADVLDSMKGHAVKAYKRHVDASDEAIIEWMDNETWFDGKDAEGMGWQFDFTDPLAVAASVTPFLDESKVPENAKEWLDRAKEISDDTETSELGPQPGPPAEPQAQSDMYEQGRQAGIQEKQQELEQYTQAVSERDKQIEQLNADLESKKQEVTTAQREKQSAEDRLQQLLPGTSAPPADIDVGDARAQWQNALKQCEGNYEKARKEYPEVYEAMREIDRTSKQEK